MNLATDQDPIIDTPPVLSIKEPKALRTYYSRVDRCRPGHDWRGRAQANNHVFVDRLLGVHAQLATMPGLAVQSS